MSQIIPNEQDISERAYEIWQAEGCPPDRALEHWLAAEREFQSKDSAPIAGTIGTRSAELAANTIPAWNGGIRKSVSENLGKKRFPVNQGKKSLTRP